MDNNGQNNGSNNNPKVVIDTSKKITINTNPNNNSNGNGNVNSNNSNINNVGENTAQSAQMSLKEHMAENERNNKPKINIMNIFIYILMLAIIGICVVLFLHFYDSGNLKSATTTKKTTTTINFDGTTDTLVSKEVHYEATTTIATNATHVVIPSGESNNSYLNTTKVRTTSTSRFTTKAPTSVAVSKTTTTKKTTTTTVKVEETTTTASTDEVTSETSNDVNENETNDQ